MNTSTPRISPGSIPPLRRPRWIIFRYPRMKYGSWILGPTLERKSQTLEFSSTSTPISSETQGCTHRSGPRLPVQMAIQLQARRDLPDAQGANDPRPSGILLGPAVPQYCRSQGQGCGVSSLELPRVLHVPF